MAKNQKPVEPDKKRVRLTAPVQVAGELAYMIGVVCAHDGVTQAELLSGYLKPFVEEHFRRVQAEIAAKVKRMDAGG